MCFGRSLVFQILPSLLFARDNFESFVDWHAKGVNSSQVNQIVIVVSPLNALMSNQISRLGSSGVRACILDVNKRTDEINPLLLHPLKPSVDLIGLIVLF